MAKTCTFRIKSGKRKGKVCGKKATYGLYPGGTPRCTKHYMNEVEDTKYTRVKPIGKDEIW